MRIWTISHEYLDRAGLLAVWRESLLALHVLSGLTKGYKNHSQLRMFSTEQHIAIQQISNYLLCILDESKTRNYKFDATKIPMSYDEKICIDTSKKQLEFEFAHLQNKLAIRDPKRYEENSLIASINHARCFCIVDSHPNYEAQKSV